MGSGQRVHLARCTEDVASTANVQPISVMHAAARDNASRRRTNGSRARHGVHGRAFLAPSTHLPSGSTGRRVLVRAQAAASAVVPLKRLVHYLWNIDLRAILNALWMSLERT